MAIPQPPKPVVIGLVTPTPLDTPVIGLVTPVQPTTIPIRTKRTSAARTGSEKNVVVTPSEFSAILDAKLQPKHRCDANVVDFIARYLESRNVSQASRAAGISVHAGFTLRKRNDIAEAIQAITDRAFLKHGYDAADVIARVKEVVEVDPGDLVGDDGSYIENLRDLPPEVRRGIKKFKAKNFYDVDPNGMKIVTGKIIEVEFWDKLKAAEMLGYEKDMFKKVHKVEHEMSKNMGDILLESRKRADERIIEVTTYSNVEATPSIGDSHE